MMKPKHAIVRWQSLELAGDPRQTGSLIHKLIQATGCCHFAQSLQPFSILPSTIYKYLSRCSGETSTHRIQYTHLGYDAFKEAVHFRFTITLTVQSCEVPALWEGSPIRLPTYTDLMLSVPMSHKAIKAQVKICPSQQIISGQNDFPHDYAVFLLFGVLLQCCSILLAIQYFLKSYIFINI